MEPKTLAIGDRVLLAGRAGAITEIHEGTAVSILFDDAQDRVMVVQLDDPDLDIL